MMANYIPCIVKRFVLFILLLLPAILSLAAVEPYQNRLKGTVRKNDVLTVKDEKFQNSAYDWSRIRNRAVDNIITFGLNRDSVWSYAKPFSCEVEFKIEYWSQPDQATPVTIDNIKLKINYDTAYGAHYKAADVYRFKNAHRYRVTIKNVTSAELGDNIPPLFVLDAQIFVDRKYLPAENKPEPVLQVSGNSGANNGNVMMARGMGTMGTAGTGTETSEILVHWSGDESADEYDLEWTFIDELSDNGKVIETASGAPSTTQLAAMFRNNATRVTVEVHDYRISLVHYSKYLLVRWRNVSYDEDDNFRREDPWNYGLQFNGTAGTGVVTLPTEWHHPDFNWQFNATYAEDGKKKEVVSYFDGALRNRQTVTVASPDNANATDDYAVVQQNVYDAFGRVAANVLPTPVDNGILKYQGNMNSSASGIYRFTDIYKNGSAACLETPSPMASITGAAWYYSSENTLSSVNKDYIPKAEGYPFSMLSYTPDNTGRVAVSGGVGLRLQPGTDPTADRVTRYFYTRPYEGELERLFGSDVGAPSHYLKKVAIDPNKQISLSYENASGQVIATALAGEKPENVDALPSKGDAVSRTYVVLSPDEIVFDRPSLTLRGYTTYVNTSLGEASIRYEIEKLVRHYEENGVSICSNCHYALKLKLVDDCGNVLRELSEPVIIGSATSDCNSTGTQAATLDKFDFNRIGTNYITFELAMDPDVIRGYTEDFIARNTNLRTEFNFVMDALQQTDFTGCFTECTTCERELGTRAYFLERLGAQLTRYGIDPYKMGGVYESWANGLYTMLLSQCRNLQAGCMGSPCEDLKQVLLADVSPGGQYAMFTTYDPEADNEVTALEAATNVISQYWRIKFPVSVPGATDYEAHKIELPNGLVTSPHDAAFTLHMLVRYWQPEWAELFLEYHPEVCALNFCQNNTTYLGWDKKVKEIYNTAADIVRIRSGLQYDRSKPAWLVNADPFFQAGAPGSQYLVQFQDDLNNYSRKVLNLTNEHTGLKSILQYVDYTLYCANSEGNMNSVSDNPWNNCTPDESCRIPDREWQAYRDVYMEVKQKYYDLLRANACSGACPVGPRSATFNCPQPGDFKFTDVVSSACSGDMKAVRVAYEGGAIADVVTLRFAYTPEYQDAANTSTITLNGKTAVLCVKNGTPLSAIYVQGVSCGEGTVPPLNTGTTFCDVVQTSAIDKIAMVEYVNLGGTNPWRTELYYIGPAIPPNTTVTVRLKSKTGPQSAVHEFTQDNVGTPFHVDYTYQFMLLTHSCSGPGGNVPVCPAIFASKQSRIPLKLTVPVPTAGDATQTEIEGMFEKEVKSYCEAQADNWMLRLDECFASNSNYEQKRDYLKMRLIQLCTMAGDKDHPAGASSLPAGMSSYGNTHNFGEVIREALGNIAFDMICNPELLDAPYPYGVHPQMAERVLGASDPAICNRLTALKDEQLRTNPGVTFYQYLTLKFGAALKLTASEVSALEKSCSNCRFLLPQPIVLPSILDPSGAGYITAAAFNQAWTEMTAIATEPEHANFPVIAANFFNHRWGFTLGYETYKTFHDKVAGNNQAADVLTGTPLFETVETDPYDCVLGQMETAIVGGIKKYRVYIEEEKEKFRSAYVTYCGNNPAKVKITTDEHIYHYTLYYYDQAGNLMRTVPPEGVQLLDDATALLAAKGRNEPNTPCTYNGPSSNTDKNVTLTQLAQTVAAGNTAMEFWLKGDFSAPKQTLINANKKYLMNMCLDGRYLHLDVYTVHRLSAGVIGFSNSNHIAVDLSGIMPVKEWLHVVVQGEQLGTKAMQVYVNGKLCPIAQNPPKASCGWQLDVNETVETLPEDLSLVKQMRVYNRQLLPDEIVANASEICMGINGAYYEALAGGSNAPLQNWGKFNTTTGGGGSGGSGTNEDRQYPLVFPAHRLATNYAYTSLGQVVQQESPDAGISKFWYDKVGRLFASQNAEQLLPAGGGTANRFSYTKYDEQGRIIEVGEKLNSTVTLTGQGFVSRPLAGQFIAAGNGANTQIISTKYDEKVTGFEHAQDNLRKRVAASLYKETEGSAVSQATYYNYDQIGNVKTLYQQIDGLQLRQIDYQYDLASGKVNKVRYVPLMGANAQPFFYQYEYDGENRVVSGSTGIGVVGTQGWDIPNPKVDVSYKYYKHGPLARIELGDQKVQGLDYAHTLQGWLKGANGKSLGRDINNDGYTGSPTVTVAKDAIAYTLDYFAGDYTPIGANNALALQWEGSVDIGADLFNGNIARSTVAIIDIGNSITSGYNYRYDQLNRLKQMRQQQLGNNVTSWAPSVDMSYAEDIAYDANGNILDYTRRAAAGSVIDQLHYNYDRENGFLKNNKLAYIQDAIGAISEVDDIENQLAGNYQYDKIGNLIADVKNKLLSVSWTVYGKIKSITFEDGSSLQYKYDVGGNRVSQTLTKNGKATTTWYVRDAGENVLAVYGKDGVEDVKWEEQHLYGIGRVGVWSPSILASGSSLNDEWNTLGKKVYELTNQLENVLATVSDVRTSENPILKSAADYYPFGMLQPYRSSGMGSYRYGFNGKENDNDVKGDGNQQDYGMRVYDPRIGRFLSIDPLTKEYPWYTPYQFAGNKPIKFVDLDGMEEGWAKFWANVDAMQTMSEAYLKTYWGADFGLNPGRLSQIRFISGGEIKEKLTGLAGNTKAATLGTLNGVAQQLTFGTYHVSAESLGLNAEQAEHYYRGTVLGGSAPLPIPFTKTGTPAALATANTAEVVVQKTVSLAIKPPSVVNATGAGEETSGSSTGSRETGQQFEPVKLPARVKGGSQLNQAIKDVSRGGGIPNLDENGVHIIYQNRRNIPRQMKWRGALEYIVRVPGERNVYRILKKQTGVDASGNAIYQYGYSTDHYTNIHDYVPKKTP